MSGGKHGEHDRRTLWQMPPRPAWLSEVNALGSTMDMAGVVPLDEHSLLDAARRNTGLDDFGDDEWIGHFRRLIRAMEEEARLNFFGRILTRSDLLLYLEARLSVTEAYNRHPEIDAQQITEPARDDEHRRRAGALEQRVGGDGGAQAQLDGRDRVCIAEAEHAADRDERRVVGRQQLAHDRRAAVGRERDAVGERAAAIEREQPATRRHGALESAAYSAARAT